MPSVSAGISTPTSMAVVAAVVGGVLEDSSDMCGRRADRAAKVVGVGEWEIADTTSDWEE